MGLLGQNCEHIMNFNDLPIKNLDLTVSKLGGHDMVACDFVYLKKNIISEDYISFEEYIKSDYGVISDFRWTNKLISHL